MDLPKIVLLATLSQPGCDVDGRDGGDMGVCDTGETSVNVAIDDARNANRVMINEIEINGTVPGTRVITPDGNDALYVGEMPIAVDLVIGDWYYMPDSRWTDLQLAFDDIPVSSQIDGKRYARENGGTYIYFGATEIEVDMAPILLEQSFGQPCPEIADSLRGAAGWQY